MHFLRSGSLVFLRSLKRLRTQECLVSMAGSQRPFTSTSSCFDLDSGLWLTGRCWHSSLFPVWFPCRPSPTCWAPSCRLPPAYCPLAGPNLCLASDSFPHPAVLAWTALLSYLFPEHVWFILEFGLSESFFLSIENHQKFSLTPGPS